VPMTMICADGAEYQCSGGTVLRTENGVALTDSGVQVYGISTSDLDPDNRNFTNASGFRLASGGVAEVRIARNGNGAVTSINLLLRNLGLSWDGISERPPIIETFNPTQGRVQLDANGRLSFLPLPPSSDLGFYDFANLGRAATQAHYANNRYFPRTANPSRCPPDVIPCPETETSGLSPTVAGPGSGAAFETSAARLHSDGDIHAGDGLPGPNGAPTFLPGGSGFGVPYPGSKGYRSLTNRRFNYANLASWITQDTVQFAGEWATSGDEHNKNRRGMLAFGDVTRPADVPVTGSASYAGIVYGWYAPTPGVDPSVYWGRVLVNADFDTRNVVITISDTVTFDGNSDPVPVVLTAVTTMGSQQTNSTNYMTGTVNNGAMSGGLSGRYFGPASSAGVAPPEIGGTFSLSSGESSGPVAIGGFIARLP
jgi:hypothetical protein